MTLKPGVRIFGVRPETLFAMTVADGLFDELFGRGNEKGEFVVTACVDGKHMAGSLHYQGLAFDFRTFNLNVGEYAMLRDRLTSALGPDFDVVHEDDHLHCEYQPKTGVNQ